MDRNARPRFPFHKPLVRGVIRQWVHRFAMDVSVEVEGKFGDAQVRCVVCSCSQFSSAVLLPCNNWRRRGRVQGHTLLAVTQSVSAVEHTVTLQVRLNSQDRVHD